MSYLKLTTILGKQENGDVKAITLNGHWNIDSAIKRGRNSKIIGEMTITHHTNDLSGMGRSGHDGRWSVNEANTPAKMAAWSEFGVEHQ